MAKRTPVLIGAAVVVAVVVAGGLWWFLRDDAPDAVSLDAARESVEATSSTTSIAAGGEPAEEGSDGIDGTWTVDTDTGDFDFESASGTFAGFRVQEELSTIGSTTAVGRTGDVNGSITIDGDAVTEGSFTVELTTITTNDERRDSRVQSALDTAQHPTATFTLTAPIDLGPGAVDGEPVTTTASGDLEIKGTTIPVEVAVEAQLVDGVIVIVGSVDITFSDFGVETPSAPIVLSVDDEGVMEFQLLLNRE
ncbi:YceI family protein [Rhabdothermincola salaria]|uniref:YceI family protein n=1 Tax=Rhabdothermincola salaria TaxID=2903142 RepID=UPI001E424D4D|nr:YceI family protein [Rhabdothermincola salaria]MCD9623230.1 YceI family protein [Rhabdothermincola salaria]